MSNKTSDENVANIEEDVKILEEFAEICKAGLACYDQTREGESLERILSEREQMLKEREKYTIRLTDEEYRKVIENAQMDTSNDKVIAIKFAVMQQQINEKDKRIQELEEENKKLKAQHVFTRNEATDEEKAELYDAIDKTLDTFLEQEKPIWQQEMKTDKMSLEEALNVVDSMYQDRYKIVQENNTIYVDRLKNVEFTNLEFASVRLLREVQSLRDYLENSIPKQVVIDKIKENSNIEKEIEEKIKEEENSGDICREYIRDLKRQKGLVKRDILTLQELLEGAEK